MVKMRFILAKLILKLRATPITNIHKKVFELPISFTGSKISFGITTPVADSAIDKMQQYEVMDFASSIKIFLRSIFSPESKPFLFKYKAMQ